MPILLLDSGKPYLHLLVGPRRPSGTTSVQVSNYVDDTGRVKLESLAQFGGAEDLPEDRLKRHS